MKKENIQTPVGFGEKDVRKDAPRLFSDLFMVFYISEMSRAGLQMYANALSSTFRQDIIEYFNLCLKDSMNIYNKAVHLLLAKGMDIAPPVIPYPKKSDFIEKDSFISMITGKTRPLTALEIKHLQLNITTNTLGKALMLAFSQVASSEELKSYFRRGTELANEQIIEMGKFLANDNLPSPKLLDPHVTDSTVSPFSDELLLYHSTMSTGVGIQNFGSAMSKILRHDIHLQFVTLSPHVAKFGNDGVKLMIEKGWLEQPPTAADREKLSKRPVIGNDFITFENESTNDEAR
ncbi:MAG: DUF3231 family protein [Bacillaceae bacterium]|nr:DUF3231 family protein [Bacillaceae bacterium]